MARTAPLIALATIALCLSPTAAAGKAPRLTCHSGKTLHQQGALRVFNVTKYFHDKGVPPAAYHLVYACAKSRPWLIDESSPYNFYAMNDFALFGRRLGFITRNTGFSSGSDTAVGWTDVKTHEVRIADVLANDDVDPPDPSFPDQALNFAIATDGTIAVLGGPTNDDQEVGVLSPKGKSSLTKPKVLFDSAMGGLDNKSLTIDDQAVHWKTKAGVAMSAPRPPVPAHAG